MIRMENQNPERTIVLTNRLDELQKISGFIDDLADEWNLPFHLTMSLNLVLEEAFTNIVNYAYQDKDEHIIEIILENNGQALDITMKDDGIPYDPTMREDPDVTLPPEEREIGGLGIFLIKKMMDKVVYRRENNHNILMMNKIIQDTPE
jgi:serine/threonine-protein kinase RsbW